MVVETKNLPADIRARLELDALISKRKLPEKVTVEITKFPGINFYTYKA